MLARAIALAATVVALVSILSPPREETSTVRDHYPFYHPKTLELFAQLNAAAKATRENPQLRNNLEITPIRDENGVVFVLRDPSGIASGTAAVTPAGLHVLELLDGTRSVDDLIRAVDRPAPNSADAEARVRRFLDSLDDNLFLFDTRYRMAVTETVTEFARSIERAPITMGGSYPPDAVATRTQIEGYLTDGKPPAPLGRIRGIVAPHIDYQRGHESYGTIYRALRQAHGTPRFVILGTAHQPSYRFFAATRKNYVTSLGAATTDQEFLDRLTHHYPYPLFDDEFLHRGEHSIELEIPFLQTLFGADVHVVPILCGSLHEFFRSRQDPMTRPEIAEFISALRQTAAESEGDTIFIAASDLSHMGPHFGDQFLMTDDVLERVRHTDQELLDHVAADDPRGLITSLSATENATRWCGVAPIYTLLETLNGSGGHSSVQVLGYQQCTDAERFTTVTIPAIAITEK